MPTIPKKVTYPLLSKIDEWINNANKGLYAGFANDFAKLKVSLKSYLYNYETEFSIEKDYFHIRGEDNIFRYLPLDRVAFCVDKSNTVFEIVSRILAAHICGVKLYISVDFAESETIGFLFENRDTLLKHTDFITRENEKNFVKCFADVERIIYSDLNKVSSFVFTEAAKIAKFIVRQKPMMEGRLELLNYLKEQTISYSYHRYGNLGDRGIDRQQIQLKELFTLELSLHPL